MPAHKNYAALLAIGLISSAHLRNLKEHKRSTDAMSMHCDQLDRGSVAQINYFAS